MSPAPPTKTTFSERERQIIMALGEVIIPQGQTVPSAGSAATVSRVESLMAGFPERLVQGFRAGLWSIEAASVPRYLRPFTRLSTDRRRRLVHSWAKGNPARRLTLRALTTPLKLAHFNDPDLCHQFGCPHTPTPARPEKARWKSQILCAEDLDPSDTTLEADVVIVGTGAGGAVVARELAARGHAVLMVEEGGYHDRVDFTTQSRVQLNQKLFREQGMLTTIGNTAIILPVGRSVGGSTTVNSGTCFRTPDAILEKWGHEFGLGELSPDHMGRHLDRVENTLGVEEAQWEHLGVVAEIIRDGCESLGFSHHPLRRNAPECDGQGVCCFGCPTDAKRSTNVSYVPLALKNNAMCLTKCRVTRILHERGQATGVEGILTQEDGQTRSVQIRARHVVLSGGSIYTPLLLLQNNLCNRWDQVGRNLTIHPALGMSGHFQREVRGWDGIPQGYCIDQFHGEGLLFEGASVPLEFASIALPLIGDQFTAAMDAYNHCAIFGFMVCDSNTGRVRQGPQNRPLVTYRLARKDVDRIQRGAEILANVFFAAGAERVYTPIAGHEILENGDDIQRLRAGRLQAWDLELSAYHPLGTCRMGVDPRTSVIDESHETHELRNLYVVDGSSVPSALGVNPQITIMALATRFAELLDARLGT